LGPKRQREDGDDLRERVPDGSGRQLGFDGASLLRPARRAVSHPGPDWGRRQLIQLCREQSR